MYVNKVKFYSEYDLACGWNLEKIVEKVNEDDIDRLWTINDVIEFYNILRYIRIQRFAKYIEQQTAINCEEYEKKIHQKIGRFIGTHKGDFIKLYDDLDITDTEDFLDIIEKYSLYKEICEDDFQAFLEKKHVHIYNVLKFKRITEIFDSSIKEKIKSDPKNVETIISKFLGESNLYLPPSLTEEEILQLLEEYIDSSKANINILRNIIAFPTGKGLTIPDKIKLHAERKEKRETEKFFSEGTGFETSVTISYLTDLDEAIVFNGDGSTIDIKVSRKWIEANIDYPTLWNNFIHLFGIVDDKFRLTICAKKNDMTAFESLLRPVGDHLYSTSFSFDFREMYADAVIQSYIRILSSLNVRIEDLIEWFFCEYLRDEFQINNFIVKMPSEFSSYFEKCRAVLPEIDRIFKQYNVLIEEGEIDQELIQMSSSSVKSNGIKSFIEKKYAYPLNGWYQTASYLLFSDQSGIFYIPTKKEFRNFLDLIIKDSVTKQDFKDYQVQKMQWLFENGLIYEDKDGFIKVFDVKSVYILKELYYNDVLNYWHYPEAIRTVIDEMESRGIVTFESTLLSRNEQDYLDFYLNKSKFTNGYDLRNSYLHGTNVYDEKQHQADYYSILKLLIIIVIKINDDLCLKEDLLTH